MYTSNLIQHLTDLEESVRVNKTSILKILDSKTMNDGDKNELIKSITIPLIINNRSIIDDMEKIYTKVNTW